MAWDNEQLLDLKDKIDTAKGKVSELNGQLQVLMNQLLNDWKCKTVEEAEKKLKEMDINITNLERKIKKGTEELEQTVEENDNPTTSE